MSNWKLLLTTAVSVGLAVGPAHASLPFTAVPHTNNLTQVQWHHRGWGWGPWAWLGLGAGVVAGAIIADEITGRIRATITTKALTMARITILRTTAAIRAKSVSRTSAPSSGVQVYIRPRRVRSVSVPT